MNNNNIDDKNHRMQYFYLLASIFKVGSLMEAFV